MQPGRVFLAKTMQHIYVYTLLLAVCVVYASAVVFLPNTGLTALLDQFVVLARL